MQLPGSVFTSLSSSITLTIYKFHWSFGNFAKQMGG